MVGKKEVGRERDWEEEEIGKRREIDIQGGHGRWDMEDGTWKMGHGRWDGMG